MCLFHLFSVFILLSRIVRTVSHSFVIGKDGNLQMIGYDVNGVYKSLAIDGNIKFKGPNSANISFEQNSSLLLISGKPSLFQSSLCQRSNDVLRGKLLNLIFPCIFLQFPNLPIARYNNTDK